MKLRQLVFPALASCVGLSLVQPCTAIAQQAGRVVGTVTSAETRQPLTGAQVSVEGTAVRATTGADGRYTLDGVPVGSQTLQAALIGHATARRENVRVATGTTATADFALRAQALSLEELVVTGVTDPIAGVKLPFTVSTVSKEALQVPTTGSAVASIQGKVAGANIVRGSGQPGSGVSILLRTPTSITRSNTPMFVVDGVILSSTIGGSTVDLESQDIEKIEVIKGAAAAALYGSRAASGVISVTTSRGKSVQQDRTQIVVRSEFGQSDLPQGVPLAQHHYFATDAQGRFIDAAGRPVTTPSQSRVIASDRILDKPFAGELYDNIGEFFRPGRFLTNSVSLAHNTRSTNFSVSYNNYSEKGIIITNDGYERNNFRVNLDHRLGDRLSLSTSAYHNRSEQDEISGDPFWDVLMFTPDIYLGARDDEGNLIQQPDPLIVRENPIWRQTSRDNTNRRARTLLSGNARYSPMAWLSAEGVLSYDRGDRMDEIYVPRGVPVVSSLDNEVTNGRLQQDRRTTDVFNASLGATANRQFGDLNARTTVRGILERESFNQAVANAENFWVQDVKRLDIGQTQTTTSLFQEIRANGYLAQTGLDYAGKYIADLLVRRDGSSLFGPEARWQTYYRASSAWRMAEEPWFNVPGVNEFKLRYSRGTAGGRPNFADQYETWSISSAGQVSKGTLGNRALAPEHTTEQEAGVDMILLNRIQLELTYATQKTEGQLIAIPLPAATGYSSQRQNAGTLEGHTYEATLQAQLIRRPRFSWNTTLVADRSRSEITDWRRVCYFEALALRCLGANLSKMYGDRFLRSVDEIPADLPRDQFQVNDDGYVVWAGSGGKWGDQTTINGVAYRWGHPIIETDSTGARAQALIGEGNADVNLGWLNQMRWGNVSLHTQMQAQVGLDVYNRTKQRLYQHFRHADLDQAGKPQEQKKPIDYYQTLYNTNNNTSHFVEDGSFLKLRELALRYTLDDGLMRRFGLSRFGADRIAVGLIGRNLFTVTNYTGYDPEVGTVFNRQDNFVWPNTRTLTANIEVAF